MCGVMYPDRSAGRQKAVVKGRQRCTMRLLTNTGKTCRVITNVTSRKPCRCLAFGVLASNRPRDYRVLIECLLTCLRYSQLNLFINRYPRGSHVLELPPTHARTTHSPCTPHPRRSTKASIGILAPNHCPMRVILILVTKPKHMVRSKHILAEPTYILVSNFGERRNTNQY